MLELRDSTYYVKLKQTFFHFHKKLTLPNESSFAATGGQKHFNVQNVQFILAVNDPLKSAPDT